MITFTPFLYVDLGPVRLTTHGIAFALGLLVAFLLARRAAKRAGLNVDLVDSLGSLLLITGIIGARIAYIAVLGRDMSVLDMLQVWEGGLSSHGGYIIAIAAGVAYLAWKKQDVLHYADVMMPYMLVGWAIGRIGCLNAIGEWGYPIDSSPFAFIMYGVPRYPTSLFETIAYLLCFALIWALRKWWPLTRARGATAGLTLFLFCISRFLIDFLREYTPEYRDFTQTVTLILAIGSLSFAVYRMIYLKNKHTS